MAELLNKDIVEKNIDISQDEIKIKKGVEELGIRLGISSESAKNLSELKTITNISILKEELSKLNVDNSKFNETHEQDEIFQKIHEIQKLRDELTSNSKIKIADLRGGLKLEKTNEYKINSDSYSIADKIFSPRILEKIKNPANIGDNIIGATIGSIESIYKIGVIGKDLVFGIIKTPVDLYKLAIGKAETDSFKNM